MAAPHANHHANTHPSTPQPTLTPALPTLVFIHGAQHDHSVWTLQSRWFAHHGYTVIAIDLPGHGSTNHSFKSTLLPTIEKMADWLLDELNSAGVTHAALIGHSMGSLVALELASRNLAPSNLPNQPLLTSITHLAMLGTAIPMRVSEALLEAAKHDEQQAMHMINQWSFSKTTRPNSWLAQTNLRLMQRAAPGVFLNDLTACNNYTRGLEVAAQVRCPSLLILGRDDQMTPPLRAQKLLAALASSNPSSKSTTIEGSGHALMAEYPDLVLNALRVFITTDTNAVTAS